MIESGKVLQHRYRIDKQIGQGGMGAVYIATDERFNSTVAIKETLFMDDNYRKAIEREARLLNSLKHAALPRVSDHFLEENVQFLVMEYIPGEDLSHMLDSGIKFDIDRVLKWADQLLDALDFLHNQSIPVIHRDIKPQNLKLTSRDQIILLDFGLAKGNPTDAGHQTAAKSIFGYSRNYASLEQIQGTGTDPRSDLYSLAATLYHLLTGIPPDDALTRAMAVLSNKPDPLKPANTLRPEMPRGAAGVLHRSLALNADDRPASATAMREMLRDHDKYGYLADPVTVLTANSFTHDPAQNTKLMPSDTRAEIGGVTDVKTELMPGFVSQETSVRPAVSTGGVSSRRRGRRGVLIGAALTAVLIACGTVAGIYMYDPAFFGDNSPDPAVTVDGQNHALGPVAENANSVGMSVEAPTSANVGNLEIAKPNSMTKTDPAKTSKQTTRNDPSVPADPDVSVSSGTIYVGNVKVGPDGITPNVWVDRNGKRHSIPSPPDAVPFPGITKEQFDQMTPQQRQKLIEARRQLQMLERQRLNVPKPANTPEKP